MVTYSELVKIRKSYWVLLGIAVLIHLFYLWSLGSGALRKFCSDSTLFPKVGADFYAIYESGWDFLHGRDIYHHDETAEQITRALASGEQRAPYYATYRYLPHFAATVGVLLNIFPPLPAYIFWIIICELILIFNIELTRRLVSTPEKFCWTLFFWLTPFPLYLEYWMGQFSLLMISLVFWTILLFLNGRRTSSTILWSYSVALKLFSYTFIPLFYRRRWIRDIAICSLVVIVPSVVYFLWYPSGFERFFFNH